MHSYHHFTVDKGAPSLYLFVNQCWSASCICMYGDAGAQAEKEGKAWGWERQQGRLFAFNNGVQFGNTCLV